MFTTKKLRARLLRDGEPGQPAGGGGATPPVDDGLNEGGRTAIQREREAAAEANRLRAAEKQRADAAEEELRRIREANQTEQEKALAAAREEGKAEVAATANTRLIRAEVKAAAASAGFNDSADAVAQLETRFGEIPVTATGDVDEAAVKAMVNKLAEDKPYLVKQAVTVPAFASNPGQGTPPAASGKADVNAGRALYQERNKPRT